MRNPINRTSLFRISLTLGLSAALMGGLRGFGAAPSSVAAMPTHPEGITPDPPAPESAWTYLPDPFASNFARRIWGLGVAPNGKLYAIGNGGVSVSPDGGKTWTVINNGLPGLKVVTLGFNSLGEPVVVVGQNPVVGVFRYTQESWHKASGIVANYRIACLAQDKTGALLAVTAWTGEVFRSTDNGNTFHKIAGPVGSPNSITVGALWVIFKANDGSLYAGGELTAGIFHSIDNGTTWQQDGLSKEEGYIGNIITLGTNAQGELLVARTLQSGGLIQRRVKTGWVASSKGLPAYGRVFAMALAPSHEIFATLKGTAETNGVYRSTDDGQTWKNISTGLPAMPWDR